MLSTGVVIATHLRGRSKKEVDMRFRITVVAMTTLTFAAFTACGGSKAVGDACDEAENRGCLRRGVDCDIVGSANFDSLVAAFGCSSQLADLEDIHFSIHKKTINRQEAIKIAKHNAKLYLRTVNPPRHFIVDAENGDVIRLNLENQPQKLILEEYIARYGKDRINSEITVWEIILKYEWTNNSTKIEVEKVKNLTIICLGGFLPRWLRRLL